MRRGTAITQASVMDFNPRTPYGMRLDKILFDVYNDKISIHAPLTGCDKGSATEVAHR